MFNNFCAECSWELIPMLLIAWLLGYLFWLLLNRSKYQSQIKDLTQQVDSWKDKSNSLEVDIKGIQYEKDKVDTEFATMRGKFADMQMEVMALKEQLQNKG
ncbi:MAG: hypothetical protein AAGG75_01150 [Bacteroidota bacterium]